MAAVAIAFKAHLGWLAAVGVEGRSAQPQPLFSCRVSLFDDAPRKVREPYHVAGGWDGLNRVAPHANPRALIERAVQAQAAAAESRLQLLRREQAATGFVWRRAVILVGRGIKHELEDAIASHAHIHVAEGDAVRDATRVALQRLGVQCVDMDEKSAMARAGEHLGLSAAECDVLLKDLRPQAASSWAKEYRTLAAAAWLSGVGVSPA